MRRYLAQEHRHLFKFRVEVNVNTDRQVEFHDLHSLAVRALWLAYPRAKWSELALDFEDDSCETIAVTLAAELSLPGLRAVEVWEDDEFGARVELQ